MTRTLYWDIETRSTVDLRRCGVYVYAMHPDTEVLLAAWAIDDGPVTWADLRSGVIPYELATALADPSTRVIAHNAGFERLLLTHNLAKRDPRWIVPSLDRWDCTAARAAKQAIPRALGKAAAVLGLDVSKDMAGHRLMMQMCKPRAARKGEDRKKIYWWDDDDRMQRLGDYCATDVEVERLLDKTLAPMPPAEKQIWMLTERMNDRGVPVDVRFANNAIWLVDDTMASLDQELERLTGGEVTAATQLARMRDYLVNTFGVTVLETPDEELTKASIANMLKRDLPDAARRILEIRLEAGMASVKKYQAIVDRANQDGRVRGNLVYHAASTGRFAGAGVQMQNMRRDGEKGFDLLAMKVNEGVSASDFRVMFGNPLERLSKMLRGTVVVKDPNETKLIWADYNAVEARGVAWLSGAEAMVQRFASNGPVYEEMAAAIYGVDASTIKNPSTERFIGKQTILGCGYGMGPPKFLESCAKFGVIIDDALAKRAVYGYREDNSEVPAAWKALENCAMQAVRNPGTAYTFRNLVSFIVQGAWLKMRLPSGRIIWYCRPTIVEKEGPYGMREQLAYYAESQLTRQWALETTWGGKIMENAVQGICRDIICHAMLDLDHRGWNPILSVHDEVICENGFGGSDDADLLARDMCWLPDWAKGFPLAAEGKEGFRYGK